MSQRLQNIEVVLAALTMAPIGLGAWPQTLAPDASVQKIRGGQAIEKIVFVKADPSMNGGFFQIYVMNADGSNVRQVTKTKTEASNPAWAPDGVAIAYSEATDGDRRGLFLMGADGSEPHRLAFSKHQDFCFPSWSPDGKYLIFTALHRVGAQGVMIGEESPRCEMWSGEFQIFSFDADGKTRQISDSKLAPSASYGRAVLLR